MLKKNYPMSDLLISRQNTGGNRPNGNPDTNRSDFLKRRTDLLMDDSRNIRVAGF
jgi:hypothetical protein